MTPEEQRQWLALADEFATLRRAIDASRIDVASSGYKPELTMKQLDDHNARLLHCESLIRNTVERNPKLLWWWRRSALGSVAYEAHHRYSRGTDDNFDWTSQANELRKARDSIYDRLIALGVIKVTQK